MSNFEELEETLFEEKIMRTKLFIVILIATASVTQAAILNIYADDTIQNGDVYDTVNIYDSLDVPPVQTTVDMTGGDISYLNVYDTSVFNFNSGSIGALTMNNSSIANLYSSDTPTMYLYDNSQIHIYNGSLGSSALIYDNAELHVYGYDLEYDETPSPNWVTGQWENGQDFKIYLRNIYSYDPDQVVLHEIPEPTTFLLFTFGSLLLRRHYKHLNPKS